MALKLKKAKKAGYVCGLGAADGNISSVFVDHGADVKVEITSDGIEITGDKAAWAAIVSAVSAIYDGIKE